MNRYNQDFSFTSIVVMISYAGLRDEIFATNCTPQLLATTSNSTLVAIRIARILLVLHHQKHRIRKYDICYEIAYFYLIPSLQS